MDSDSLRVVFGEHSIAGYVMSKGDRIVSFTVRVALIMSLIAFVLGSAPFTPALVLAIIALPVAAVCAFFSVWRLSVITTYWAVAAFLAVPMSEALSLSVDVSLLVLGIAGLALSVLLYFGYIRSKSVG